MVTWRSTINRIYSEQYGLRSVESIGPDDDDNVSVKMCWLSSNYKHIIHLHFDSDLTWRMANV